MVMTAEMLEKMKDEYYQCGAGTGRRASPRRERLLKLDLPDIAEDMRKILGREKER